MVMLHFKIEKKTDKKIVEYFGNLEKELLEGKLSWLLENLSCPDRFLFPSYEQIVYCSYACLWCIPGLNAKAVCIPD